MIKKDLVKEVADELGLKKKDVKRVLEFSFEKIKETVADGDKVSFVGFGVFEKRHRKEKKGTVPKTNEELIIPATDVPYFRPGKSFKKLVKK